MFKYKTQNKHGIFRRFHAFVFVFAILLTSSVVTLNTSRDVAAADIPYGADTAKRIEALVLHRFLGFCINHAPLADGGLFNGGRDIDTTAKVNAGQWFTDESPIIRQTSAPIGPFILDKGVTLVGDRSEGRAHCGNEQIIKMALDSLGVSGEQLLCSIGFVRDSGPCIGGNGTYSHANNSDQGSADSYNAFMQKYPEPTLDDLGWYWFYRKTFNWSCGYGKMGTPVSQADAQYDPQYGYALVYVSSDPPSYKSTKYFVGYEPRNRSINTRLAPGGSADPVVRTCAEIEGHINDYGNRVASSPDLIETAAGQEPAPDGTGSSTPGATSCSIEGIGWIVCPATTAIATMTDALYGWIQNFLAVQPLNVDTASSSNTTYIAWSAMRSIANILFVIAFIIIIFSQLTGVGVSNYGVKKLLPRLVIAAILVNVSYWIVAIAVDLSNIFGSWIYNILRDVPLGNITITDNLWENVIGGLIAGGTITGAVIAGSAVAVETTGGAVLTAAVWGAIVFVLAAVLALVIAFIILAIRQAFIIIFIVLAPLAFVAYLLPNTEKYFSTWRKTFITLLLFYPLFSVLFGGSYLAGMIIIGSAGQAGEDGAVASLVLIGMAVMIVPLALTPLLIRFSTGILGTIAGMVNNRSKGLVDRARNVRRRKSGLAFNETFGGPNSRRNPFTRLYRRVQGSAAGDAERKKIVDTRNQANFLETQRSKNLNLKSGLEQERVKTAQGEQNAEFENTVLADNTLMEMRQQQDASERATGRHKALQNEKIESNLSVTSMMNEQQKANAELKTSVIKNQRELDIEKNQLSSTELKNVKLQKAAVEKESGVLNQQFQQVVAEAGSVKGAEKLKDLGYDEDTLTQINKAQTQASVISSATTSAQNIQQQEYAQTLTDNVLQVRSHDGPAVSIQEAAGGIDPQGASRVRAAANAVNLEVINKAIASEKSTMTSMPVRTTAATATQPERPGLMEILTTTVVNEKGETVYAATPERMAAAAGQIIRVGGDADIHALIDQVDRMPEDTDERRETKSLILQQIASDIGPRTPTSLGAGTLSNMARGVPVGGFDKMVSGRLTSGKVSPEKLFTGTSAEELERMIAVISDPKRFTAPSTPEEVANLANLKSDIKNYLDNPTTKPPTPEIARLVEQLREKLPG